MICERCHGEGTVPAMLVGPAPAFRVYTIAEAMAVLPCPVCGGCGIASCCDGMVPTQEGPDGNE